MLIEPLIKLKVIYWALCSLQFFCRTERKLFSIYSMPILTLGPSFGSLIAIPFFFMYPSILINWNRKTKMNFSHTEAILTSKIRLSKMQPEYPSIRKQIAWQQVTHLRHRLFTIAPSRVVLIFYLNFVVFWEKQ